MYNRGRQISKVEYNLSCSFFLAKSKSTYACYNVCNHNFFAEHQIDEEFLKAVRGLFDDIFNNPTLDHHLKTPDQICQEFAVSNITTIVIIRCLNIS